MAGKHVNPCCAPKDKRQQAGGTVRKSGRIIAALLLMILAFGIGYAVFTSASAATIASGKCGGSAEWALTKDGTLTISGTGAMEDYDYTNRPEWDDHKDLIKAVKISDGITNIGSDAFDSCKALAEVTMPDTVTSIGSAFCYCEKLTEITIPDGVTDIGGAAFFGCWGLMDINVSRGNEAYCSIDGIVFNKSGSELIRFPSGRTGSYTVPDSVTSICDYAFNGCSSLTEIIIPDSVTSIGSSAFNGCTGLTWMTIPDSVTSIASAFNNCRALTEITLSDSVTSIDDYTFSGCVSLADITIPDGVTSIGDWTFSYCTSLTEITIPGSVTSIGDYAFDNCDELSDVYYDGSESDWNRIIIGNGNDCLTFANIHYNSAIPAQGVQPAPTPVLTSAIIASGKCGGSAEWALTKDGTLTISGTGAMEDYPSSGTQSWSEYVKDVKNARIFDGITHISTYAFSGCTALADITIPNSVTSIDGSEFIGCTALADITIPDSVTNIGGLTFSHCDSLTDIDVSQGNEAYCSIDGVLFNKTGSELICFPAGRSGSYTIPSGVTSIGDYAFYGDTALTEIFIPASVTSIEWGAFSLWNTLSDVYYEGSESDWQKIEIDNYGNISLLNAKIHYNSAMPVQGAEPASAPAQNPAATVASGKCGGSAEWALTDDGTLTISGTGTMEDYGYPVRPEWEDYMNMIKTVRISDGVTSIGDSAFSGCMALTEITIPGSLTNIGFDPFFACYALMDINVDQSNEVYSSIDGVLFNKTASELVCFPKGRTGSYTIPDSVTSIGDLAFNGCKGLTEITIPGSAMNNIFITAFIGCDNLSDVYYGGSEGDWQKIGDCFIDLTNVKIHYNASA